MKTFEFLMIATVFVIGCHSQETSTISYDDIDLSGYNIQNESNEMLKALRLFYVKSYTLINSENPRLASTMSIKIAYIIRQVDAVNNDWTDGLSRSEKRAKLQKILMPLATSLVSDFMQLPKRIQLKIGRYGVECLQTVMNIVINAFTAFLDQEESKLRLTDNSPYQYKYGVEQIYAAKQDSTFQGDIEENRTK